MEMVEVLIDQIKPAAYNPRAIDAKSFENLQRSLDTYGMPQPVVVNKRNNTIVGGHQRWEAAKALAWEKVPVVYVDLDDTEERKLNIALNDPKFQGEFDTDKLSEVLHGLGEEDLADLDYTMEEVETLQDGYVDHAEIEAEDDEDDDSGSSSKAKSYTKEDLKKLANNYYAPAAAAEFVNWLP
jgi:ParB-like chromosome segregation protein Spo0J